MAQPLWQSLTRRILAWEVRGGFSESAVHGGAQRRKQPVAEQHSLASESRLSSSLGVNEPVVVVVVFVHVDVCAPG